VSRNGDQNHWNITFLRSPNDWEEESVLNLLVLLANTKVALVDDDKFIWPHGSKAKFTIKSFYRESMKDRVILLLPAQSRGLKLLPKLAFWLR